MNKKSLREFFSKVRRVVTNPDEAWWYLNHKIVKPFLEAVFYQWLRRSDWIWPKYRIEGCRTLHGDELVVLKNPFVQPYRWAGGMQNDYVQLKELIFEKLETGEAYSVIRLNDAEACILHERHEGTIKERQLTDASMDELDHDQWFNELGENDLETFAIRWTLRQMWEPFLGDWIQDDFVPLNVVYALVATRDLFDMIRDRDVALIGSDEKIPIIKQLMQYERYRDYIGLESIEQYITVPGRGACNNPGAVKESIFEQNEVDCDIYLVGMGAVSLRLLSSIRDEFRSLILDVGAGIDAMAGVVQKDKPMFGDWINFKLSDYDYEDIDIFRYHSDPSHFDYPDDIVLP